MTIAEVFLVEMLQHPRYNPGAPTNAASISTAALSKDRQSDSACSVTLSVDSSAYSNDVCVTPTTPSKRVLTRFSSEEKTMVSRERKAHLADGLNLASSDVKVDSGALPVDISLASLFNSAHIHLRNHVAGASGSDHNFALHRAISAEARPPTQVASHLRSVARSLGAVEDSTGRIVVTPQMAKGLKRALREVRSMHKIPPAKRHATDALIQNSTDVNA
jgi:hypothetical protein